MLNLSRIQLELERAKEGLREVEETIQKVEGKAFPNGPGRYSNLKVQLHSDKSRNPIINEDTKLQRRIIASNIEPRNRRLSTDDLSFNLKRGPRDKREAGLKRQAIDTRTQSISTRLTGPSHQQTADDEDDEEFTKKLALPSRVITTAAEAPSRQEVIAAQTGDELSKQRNRRMFGALVGTLQKFCKEETRVREREEKRLKVEKKLEEDAKREKEKLLQEKRELFLERKRREIEIKRIEWSLNRVKEYEAWEANVLPLKNFIQTHAKPHIFYLPSSHNSKTEERLAQSQKLVERMIEKRKNNLKEEIENSEKKARRTAAEEEDEEAENIPQNSDSVQNVEPSVEIDFDAISKENGFHEDESKTEEVERKGEEPGKEEASWSEKDTDGDEKEESSENKLKNEPEEKPVDNSNNACSEGGGDSDGGGEDRKNCVDAGEGRTFEEEVGKEPKDETSEVTAEATAEEVPISESEKSTGDKLCVQSESSQAASQDSKLCESEEKKEEEEEDSGTKNAKKSPEKKTSSKRRRSSDRRSRSPRRFAKTRRRSRSGSRRRKSSFRRNSKSTSPSKKSRRSPRARRRSERRTSSSSRRKSSRSRRRSSSKSSGSASPRKRMKFRSSSYSNSRSDSD